MDVQAIDQQYLQLQQQAQGTIQELSALANKLQVASPTDPNAREWLLDLKSVALSVQAEQNQVALLLQALHGFVANQAAPAPAPDTWAQPASAPPSGVSQSYGLPGQAGNLLGNFLSSGFARAIENGAGFGIGDDLIRKIF